MNKSLFLLSQESQDLKSKIIESGGEITPEIDALLVVNEKELSAKVDSYKFIIDDFEAFTAMLKAREESLYQVRKSMENSIDRLKKNIKDAMLSMDTQEIKGMEYSFKLSDSKPSVVVENEALIPDQYKIFPVAVAKIDKESILRDYKSGNLVEGASVVPNKSLKISLNKGK